MDAISFFKPQRRNESTNPATASTATMIKKYVRKTSLCSASLGDMIQRLPEFDFSRNARMVRRSRTQIVWVHPATTTAQVQSKTVNPPKWIDPAFHQISPSVIHAPRCSVTIRHGLDIAP